jgi:hypothetical protein
MADTDKIKPANDDKPVIEQLEPKSDLHQFVLTKLSDRIAMSERAMSKFYSRWNLNESKFQAYIDLPEYERVLKDMKGKKQAPEVVSIIVPYSFATIWTIVTYMVHTFGGRKPIFQVGAHSREAVNPAKHMETLLQYNADQVRLITAFFQWFLDGEIYGVGAMRTLWTEKFAFRSQMQQGSIAGMAMPGIKSQNMKTRVRKKVYEGNDVANIDPFMFFPDPRVPMSKVNEKGEFVFWRSFEGEHTLRREAAKGTLKWVHEATKEGRTTPGYTSEATPSSERSLISGGEAHPGNPFMQDYRSLPFFQYDQGTVDLIPKDWKLGEGEEPEKWLFSIVNKTQIVQAERLDLDHGRHPVSVIEPLAFGHGFGMPGTADLLGPIQDALSWFMNSHIYNVRSALNNMFVVDPSLVEMQDLRDQGPGKLIRIKRAAIGQDVRTLVSQLQVQDVTSGHIDKMQSFMRMGDAMSAVNDNLRGIQEAGGRKTATEVRTSGEAGASRLAARARYISSQGMVDLAEQMACNIQQNQTMEYYLKIVGEEGAAEPTPITPESVLGDFHFPVHDGTLPLDRVALLDVWKEIFLALASNPQLGPQYDVQGIFEFMADLGGAKNLRDFKRMTTPQPMVGNVTAMPDEQLAAAAQGGNVVPIQP